MAGIAKKLDPSLKKKIGWAAVGLGTLLAASAIYRELTKYKLRGKVVLITGGSRGLGLELARQFAARGARLAICARSTEQLKKAQHELESAGAEVMAFTADVTDREQVEDMIYSVVDHYGQIDVVVNNAGIIQVGPQDTMGVEEYEKAMKTHFWAPLYVMLASIPYFKDQGEGRIVNITSIGGIIAVPHLLPYTVSKFAMVGLSEGMHAELKKHNIHVLTVVPNLMRTGSPRNVTVKGNHEAEYAWFKSSGSMPLLSQKVEFAARNIIKAIEFEKSEAILSTSAKLIALMKGVAPGWVNILLSLANQFLPDNVTGGYRSKKGYESESKSSQGWVSSLSDKAAKRNNEF